jgi:hypothetical protein
MFNFDLYPVTMTNFGSLRIASTPRASPDMVLLPGKLQTTSSTIIVCQGTLIAGTQSGDESFGDFLLCALCHLEPPVFVSR